MNLKIKIISLFLIVMSFSCNKKTTIHLEYLKDVDLDWLPYNVGDSLFFYQNDSLKSYTTVRDMGTNFILNKEIDKNEKSNSQTKEIYFERKDDNFFLPMSFTIAYQEDTLSIVDHDFCYNCKWMPLFLGEKSFIVDNNTIISDVVMLKQNKKYSNSLYFFKNKIGLVQFTNIVGETFLVKTKRIK